MRTTARATPLRPTRRRRIVSVQAAARSLRIPAHDVVDAARLGHLPMLIERGRLLIDLGKVANLLSPPARGRFVAPTRTRSRV